MKLEIVRADPAGNITIFVLNPPESSGEQAAAVKALMADPALGAEQAGFVFSREAPPRLEMMGGEFCGNAARSFGLLMARERGLQGRGELDVRVSGAEKPLKARFDLAAGTASVEVPPPRFWRTLRFREHPLACCNFEGISHVIAPELPPGKTLFEEIRGIFEEDRRSQGLPLPSALGVMFWEPRQALMSPGVYVYGTGSLVFESSCGSGSAALGLYLGENLRDGSAAFAITQAGGLIETAIEKQAGRVLRVSIGGPVALGRTVSAVY
jgi:diaminopimelate epimerase